MKLKEIMSTVDVFHGPDEALITVAQSLAEKHHSCAMICQYDRPMGIITERDLVRLFTQQAAGRLSYDVTVGEVMTLQPVCIQADTELLDALELAKRHNLRHFPIVDSTQQLIGIVTQTDMIKAYLSSMIENHLLEGENHRLHILSIEDPLTELPNRRAMEIDLRHAAAIATRKSEPYSVALIDIDFFKKFNDHYGHQAGDDALIHLTSKLKDNLRDSDKIYRYGGEEFLFLMPFTSLEGALIATRRLVELIDQDSYTHADSPFGHLTVSIGVTCSTSANWKQVVDLADSALYDAKEEGRNRVCSLLPAAKAETEFWDLGKRDRTESRPEG